MTEQKITRWQEMAGNRNARVVLCNTPDTYALTDLSRFADRCVRNLRNRLLITLQPEDVLPLLEEYKGAIINLNTVIEKMSDLAGIDYTPPRSVKRMIGDGEEDVGDSKNNKLAE